LTRLANLLKYNCNPGKRKKERRQINSNFNEPKRKKINKKIFFKRLLAKIGNISNKSFIENTSKKRWQICFLN